MQNEEGLFPTTTNRLAMLHLGSTTTNSTVAGSVIFSDPCSVCGTMKRRSSCLQETPVCEPRTKKILLGSCSMKSPTETLSPSSMNNLSELQPNPFISSSISNPTKTQNSPSVISLLGPRTSPLMRRCYSDPFTSPGNGYSPLKSSELFARSESPQAQAVAYLDRMSSFSGSSDVLQVSGEEGSTPPSATAMASLPPRPYLSRCFSDPNSSTTPKSLENLAKTDTPQSKPVAAAYRNRLNSFSVSSGVQQTSAEGTPSPVKASLLPRRSLNRSFSDSKSPTTPTATLNDKGTTLTTSGEKTSGDGVTVPDCRENPAMKRWRRMRESLKEMNLWLNNMIQEHNKDEEEEQQQQQSEEEKGDDDDEEEEEEEQSEEEKREDEDDDKEEEDEEKGEDEEEIAEEEKIDNKLVVHENVGEDVQGTVAEDELSTERDDDAIKVRYVCGCGKRYHFVLSV